MFIALSKYQDGFYDDFLILLWKEYNQINVEVLDYLYNKYKEQSLELILNSLSNSNEYYDKTSSIERMFSIFIEENISIKDIFIDQIPELNVHLFKIYFELIDYVWCEDIKEVLINRLMSETNGRIIIPIYKKLHNEGDQEIIRRLKEIYNKNKNDYKDSNKSQINDILSVN